MKHSKLAFPGALPKTSNPLRVAALWALLAALPAAACASEKRAEPTPATATDLAPFSRETESGERFGYQDSAGKTVVEPRFLVAGDFSESGLAAVVDESGWAYVDVRGQVLIRPFVFDNGPDPFSEGLARFERDGRFGFFNERGAVAIEPNFEFAGPFSEGLAAVCSGCRRESAGEHWFMTGGKWGYIDKSGALAIPLRYDEAGPFEAGGARVVEAGQPVLIGKDGNRQ